MGCGASMSDEAKKMQSMSRMIDKEINREERESNNTIKALLIGTGASGKSTICKQMRLLFLNGYSKKDSMAFREPIVLNMMRNMITICEMAAKWEYAYAEGNQATVNKLLGMQLGVGVELDVEMGQALSKVWEDEATKKVMARVNETSIDDAHPYFMQHVPRIADPDFVPSTDDILRCRVKTLGIHETHFHSPNALDFTLVDVGGQRTERRKWIHCFEDVTIVLFVIALSEYDLVCEEDALTNRLDESLKLFEQIVNNKYFKQTDIFIFYNKDDLFKEKVPMQEFAKFHPEYKGKNTVDDVRSYISNRFESLNKTSSKVRDIYSHVTCATDTKQIEVVWMSVADVLLRENLAQAGFSQDV